MQCRHVAVAFALVLGACKKGEDKPKPAPAPAAAATPVLIFVDDQQVGTLAPDQAQQWPRLDTLVPVPDRRLGTWKAISLVIKGGGVTVNNPSATHPDQVPALFPGGSGVSFGMFDPVELAKKGTPALRHDEVLQVRIALDKNSGRGQNDQSEGGGSDPTKLVLNIKSKSGEQTFTGEKLLAMPRESAPGNADPHAGWRLLAVLEQVGIKSPKRLLLTDATGTNVTLEEQDLDPAKSVPFLKLNRQGSLRFRVFYKEGATWQMRADLRGLASVEVLQ
jgi:hypothetical protein